MERPRGERGVLYEGPGFRRKALTPLCREGCLSERLTSLCYSPVMEHLRLRYDGTVRQRTEWTQPNTMRESHDYSSKMHLYVYSKRNSPLYRWSRTGPGR